MGRKTPRHDDLILRLLESGRIVVSEDHEDTVEANGERKPKTKIFVRDGRSKSGKLREQTMHPNIGGHPYFSIYPMGRKGGMVWLNARRVIWYAFHPQRTWLMACAIDGNPWNYHIWNLCLRDQNDENYIRMQNQNKPEEDDATAPPTTCNGWDDDIPF